MKPLLSIVVAVAASGTLSAIPQEFTAADLAEGLGIEVKHWDPEGRLTATWSFADKVQARTFAREGVAPEVVPKRGFVFQPAMVNPAIATLHEIQLRAPFSLEIEVVPDSAEASLEVLFTEASRAFQTVCYLNRAVEGDDTRSAGGYREGFLGSSLGERVELAFERGKTQRIRFEVKGRAFSMTLPGREEPLAADSKWPHRTFRLSFKVEGGELALRSLQLDAACVPDTVRKLLKATSASGRAGAVEKARAESGDGWTAAQAEMDAERSDALIDCLRGEDQATRKAIDVALEACRNDWPERAIAALPESGEGANPPPRVLWMLGRARLAAGDTGPAREALAEAARRAPKVPEFWRELGSACSQIGDDEQALAAFQTAEELAPDSPWVHLVRAKHHITQGRAEAVDRDLEAARAKGKSSRTVRGAIAGIDRLRSRPDWAKAYKAAKGAYVIESDVSEALCTEMAAKLDAYRKFLEESLPLPRKQTAPCRVWVFDSEEGYKVFTDLISRRLENSLGVYNPAIKTLLFFHTLESAETEAVLLHEAFHQYLDIAVPDAPIWLNEGMAEYYGATKFDAGGRPVEGGIQLGRLGNLLSDMHRSGVVPFPSIIRMSRSTFMAIEPARNYAQAWAMIHWFKRGPNAEAGAAFRRYLDAIVGGKSSKQAWDDGFGAVPAATFDRWHQEFGDYSRKLLFKAR